MPNVIEAIYYNYFDNYDEQMEEPKELAELYDKAYKTLCPKGKEEDIFMNVVFSYRRFGFEMGFKLAMALMKEANL